MLNRFKNAFLCTVLALLILVPTHAKAQSANITPYENMHLNDAESALREFLSAYHRGDFLVAYWILTPEAQTELQRQLAMFNTDRFFSAKIDFKDLALVFPAQADMEQTDFGFLFADMMRFALARGIQPLDVTGLPDDLSKSNVPEIGRRTERTDGKVEYAVTLKAYPKPVIFRLQTSPRGRWRVHQVLLPGGDETSLPFALPKVAGH